MLDAQLRRKIVENLWGPGGTLLIHLVVVTMLFSCVSLQSRQTQREVEVVIRDIEAFDDLEEFEEELKELEDVPTVVDTVAPPSVSMDEKPPQVEVASPTGAEGPDMSQMDVMEAVSPLRFKGFWSSRTAGGRAGALKEYGGGMGGRTEYAVKKALEWLREHQYPDGSWGPRYRVAMTSLSLLAMFAHGETTSSPEYGQSIKKGLKYLLSRQKNGVFIGGGPWHHATQVRVYEHAIGTYAISEAYGLTSIPFLKYSMEDAVQVIIDGQHEAGSWDYGYVHGPEAHIDTSLSGWHIQALKAAAAAGAENQGLKTAIDFSMRGLKSQFNGKVGMFQYGTRAKHPPDMSMTAVAVLCMQLVGHVSDAEARAGMDELKKCPFRWTKGDVPNEDKRMVGAWPIYAWYYITQARFHQGGSAWVSWNKQFAPLLCAMQNDNGSWCPAPASSEASLGPVYSTALSTLMLEVYYRFLPTYKPIKIEQGNAVEEDDAGDEIVIEFGA